MHWLIWWQVETTLYGDHIFINLVFFHFLYFHLWCASNQLFRKICSSILHYFHLSVIYSFIQFAFPWILLLNSRDLNPNVWKICKKRVSILWIQMEFIFLLLFSLLFWGWQETIWRHGLREVSRWGFFLFVGLDFEGRSCSGCVENFFTLL